MKDLRKQPLVVLINTAIALVVGQIPLKDADAIGAEPQKCAEITATIKSKLALKLEQSPEVVEAMLAGFSVNPQSTLPDITNAILAKYLEYTRSEPSRTLLGRY